MSSRLENVWVSWLDSDRWRQFSKRGLGAKLFQSQAFRKMNLVRRYALTYYKSHRRPALFEDVSVFCMFMGHAKSGGTLIGSLLDAHPDVILADETDVLRYVSAGFSREQIYHVLLKGSRREALKGRVTARRLEPYSFAVPGQWQGRHRRIRVIGHSRAGPSTGKLSGDPTLLGALRKRMGPADVRLIHVIRNPYDPISLMMVRGQRSFANAINHYFEYCQTLLALREQLDESNLVTVRYEEFIAHPKKHLEAVCHFLGIEAEEDYLDACAGILYDTPEESRHQIPWDDRWIETVQKKAEEVDFLSGYTFEGNDRPPAEMKAQPEIAQRAGAGR